ncbi:ribose-5-phosphate isomerase RpiA [Halalkalibacillus halophilus]|uniref:ribose-5-phosphate isomerase RpiA n=1 Tax=Halalkalibacillus halophilus TaxID=392827 RepID=UPI000419DEF1|nr:ribose-5-phosphate isomerase RpiA [Halalkalibacillus halophilus]
MAEMDKKKVAEAALTQVESGMVVGLGSGSTLAFFMEALGELISDDFTVYGVPTSVKTEKLASKYNIPLVELTDDLVIDVTIDGADHIYEDGSMIKGGGGSLVREKIVAMHSQRNVYISDASKLSKHVAQVILPVEIVPFGYKRTQLTVANQLGAKAELRMQGEDPFISDNGNYIIDCYLNDTGLLNRVDRQLKLLTGVVETGIFTDLADEILIADNEEVYRYL